MGDISLWKEEYKVGNIEIDDQHKQLFAKIEGLLRITAAGDLEVDKKECLEIIDFLSSYTIYHFEAEEAYQREIGYVSYMEHAKIHEQFKNTVFMYKEKIEKDFTKETLDQFVGTLMTWLTIHVCICDKKIEKNEPLDLGADITFEDTDDLIRKVTIMFLANTYNIGINNARTTVYSGYIEGKVIVRHIVTGLKKHVFLYGFSEEMARALYQKISSMEIGSIDTLNDIEQSALIELGDILSSYAMAHINKEGYTKFDWKGDLFMNEYTDTSIDINNSVMLEFDTECGKLEILYCIVG